jgi:hypothetical protein
MDSTTIEARITQMVRFLLLCSFSAKDNHRDKPSALMKLRAQCATLALEITRHVCHPMGEQCDFMILSLYISQFIGTRNASVSPFPSLDECSLFNLYLLVAVKLVNG